MEIGEEGEIEEETTTTTMMIDTDAAAPPPHPPSKAEKSPYELLQQSKTSMEEIISKMLSVKKQLNGDDGANNRKTQLPELVTQMLLNLVNLRQANRTILLEEDRVKAETEKAKAPVDFTTLQLHNLMYEKSHYVKAIKACKDFKSKYPDIELVSEEEFFRDASEEIKSGVASDDSAHNLMLKRLNFELFQRKELCKHSAKLEQSKKKLMETVVNRKKFLSSLPSHLKSLKKASLPVQNQLGIQHTRKLKQHNLAELLPPPLYVIYSQLLAQKEAFGEGIDLEIIGSVKDAQAYARQQANKDSGNPTNTESSRVEEDALDEEDDGQRRRKRPKKVPNKDTVDEAGIYQSHPLKVTLHIYENGVSDPMSAKLITLKFEYLPKLNVACVAIEDSHEGPESNILCNLFPDDTGLELPLQSAKLIVGDAFAFDERRTSRPYKWVQHLAGIDFLPESCPLLTESETSATEGAKSSVFSSGLSLYRQQNRVETVIRRIRSRKKAQLALLEQLDSLLTLKFPDLKCESVPWVSYSPFCTLHEWSQAGPSPPSQLVSLLDSATEKAQETPLEIDVDGRHETSKEVEGAREDGELPSHVPATSLVNFVKPIPGKESERSREVALISKSAVISIYKSTSQSFKKVDDDLELMLDSDSDMGEAAQLEPETEAPTKADNNLWINYGAREYHLVLIRKMETSGMNYKLEAKIKIGMEYPLRPPLFALNLYTTIGESNSHINGCDWYNELRAMEAEVNLNMLKALPSDQESYTLAHQVKFLAMLFDLYMEEAFPSSEKSKTSSAGGGGAAGLLCGSLTSQILARSIRGRDRRKMINWNNME